MKRTIIKEAIKTVLRKKLNELALGSNKNTPKKDQHGILTGKKNQDGDPEVLVVGYGTMQLSTLKKTTITGLESVQTELKKGHYDNVDHLLQPTGILVLFIKALKEINEILPMNIKESTDQSSHPYQVDSAISKIVLGVEDDLITVVSCDSSQEEINKNVWNLVATKAKQLGLQGVAYNDALKGAMKRLGYASNSPNIQTEDDTAVSSAADTISNALTAQSAMNPADQAKITNLQTQKSKLQKDLDVAKGKMAELIKPFQRKVDQYTEKIGRITMSIERAQKAS
jgi:hypothetical protein